MTSNAHLITHSFFFPGGNDILSESSTTKSSADLHERIVGVCECLGLWVPVHKLHSHYESTPEVEVCCYTIEHLNDEVLLETSPYSYASNTV